MAKPKKKKSCSRSLMNRSDIPYAQRIAMQHQADIEYNREHSARIYMYCLCKALHEKEKKGYKSLVRFSLVFMELIKEFYEDPELAMARIKRRLAQNGIEVSGEFFSVKLSGATTKEQEIHDHSLQAIQAAQYVGAVAMNDVFGFANIRQERLCEAVRENTARYPKEGDGFLLDYMKKIGFKVEGNKVMAFVDDDGKAVPVSGAIKEGWADGKHKAADL